MFLAFSVFGSDSSTHQSVTCLECAWPSVCAPLSATRCEVPPQWHCLKNGIVFTMSATLWPIDEGKMKAPSGPAASQRPG